MTLWSYGLTKSCDKLKSIYLHYHSASGHQTVQPGIYLKRILPIKSHGSWNTSTLEITSTTTDHIITKLGRMDYFEALLAINSNNPLIMQSFEFTLQIKINISSIQQFPWQPTIAEFWLTLRDSYLYSHMVIEILGLVRWRSNLESISLPTQFLRPRNLSGW